MLPSPLAEAETLRADVADPKRREGRGRGTVWSILIAGFAMSTAAAAPFVVAGFDSRVDPASPPVFSGAAVLVVAVLASRWLGLGRAGALSMAACMSLGWQARVFLREPINSASMDFDALVYAVLTPCVFMIAFGALWLLAACAARVRIELRCSASRFLGVALLIVSTVTIVGAARRHASYPDPRSASASVEALGSFDGGEEGKGPGLSRNRLVSGPFTLTMQAKGTRDCIIHIAKSGHEVGAFTYDKGPRPVGVRATDGVDMCARTLIERYRKTDLWIAAYPLNVGPVDSQGFAGPDFRPRGVTYESLAGDLSPPVAWIVGALAGMVVAFLSLRRRDRDLREHMTWIEEIRDGVAVLVRPLHGEPGYRESARSAVSVPGTHAEVRSRLLVLATERWMFAIAGLALTSTPLLVAAARGFVF
jgi:hypothetical protein